jgi:uncharacterized protein YdaT
MKILKTSMPIYSRCDRIQSGPYSVLTLFNHGNHYSNKSVKVYLSESITYANQGIKRAKEMSEGEQSKVVTNQNQKCF